jgi:hypothetical protein
MTKGRNKDREQVLSGSFFHTLNSISFHGLSQRLPHRLFAVLVAYMLQHGPSGLRATAAQSVIELTDAQGVRAHVASEGHATVISWDPVDCVHQAEHTPWLFLPG